MILELFQTATQLPPTVTPTPLPTSTSTPVPTPLPEVRIETADQYFFNGDYERAGQQYSLALNDKTDNEHIAASEIGLARIEYNRGNYSKCQVILEEKLDQLADTRQAPELWYLLADCFQGQKLYAKEAEALDQYKRLKPDTSISSEIDERIGNAWKNAGQYPKARESYLSAISDSHSLQNDYLWMYVADTYNQEGDTSNAIDTWLKIYQASDNDQQRAQIDYNLGNAYFSQKDTEKAFIYFQDAVNNYPSFYAAFSSLLILLDQNQTVNEYQRGLINYYVGQYSLSMEAFYRYMKTSPNHDGSSWYYIGLCQMYLASYNEAITSFQTIIDDYPDNKYLVSAYDELAYVQWNYQEHFSNAAQTLLDYVSLHPDQPDAASFIYEAGRILERGNRLSDAAKQWERLVDEYPLYEKSDDALFLAAICRYRSENYEGALAALNRLLLRSQIPNDQARAHFWIAKIYEKKNDNVNARKFYEQAAKEAPADYYGERALDILSGKDHLSFSEIGSANLTVNLEQEKTIADQWVRINFNIDDSISLDSLSDISKNNNYQKAMELWNLGKYEQALNTFDTVRTDYEKDPLNSYRLLNRLIQLGAWRPAVFISRQILTLAGLNEDVRTLSAPNYFNHIRFGTWFSESVLDSSKKYNIHPFILFALMRQESMYDPWIVSSAGAKGLMQIMPETGQEIAKNLLWPKDYTDNDLNRASVSIEFSASYLSRQYLYFDNDYFKMLSSYNAGAGNTVPWSDISGKDPDLFVEIIRFEETRTYIHNIYDFAKMYENLYGSSK